MIAVGIDVSKGKSTVAILDGDGSIRAHPYEMNHSKTELDALIKYIKAVDDHPIILMEPTSHYHYPVLKAFRDSHKNYSQKLFYIRFHSTLFPSQSFNFCESAGTSPDSS